MNIVQSIMTNNPCYRAGRKIAVKGLMLHSVGCAQPSAKVFINTFNKSTYTAACVHGFIDANTGTVYQTLPWDHRGWHGGSGNKGCCNNTHIGVEMCEPSQIKYTSGGRFTCTDTAAAKAAVDRTYTAAVELFAYLCKLYGLNPMTDICSHKEGCAKGIATNHGDPEHLWNGLSTGYTMDGFRRDVKNMMNNEGGLTMTQYEELKTAIAELEKKNAAQDDIINKVGAELQSLQVANDALVNVVESTFVYNYNDNNIPEWARPALTAAMDCSAVQGDENGALHLSYKDLRTIVREYRRGMYDVA